MSRINNNRKRIKTSVPAQVMVSPSKQKDYVAYARKHTEGSNDPQDDQTYERNSFIKDERHLMPDASNL